LKEIWRDWEKARKENDVKEAAALSTLHTVLGSYDFNPGSPVQVKNLLKLLGCSDINSSNDKDLNKAKLRHPLNNHIISLVQKIRKLRKENSNYLRLDSDADKGKDNGSKELNGRILYALNPDGTETGRLASREHHFWCGLQIHNITRGPSVKQTIKSSAGFYLGECDLEQAESRDTAYISGETALISAVESERDFHSTNCSAFFGIPYDRIYDDRTKRPKDKKLRDLAKRVNHGANYNMGAGVLIDTMGLDKIWEAGRLLKLPTTDPKAIAEYLLECFHRTYPRIRKAYYVEVVSEIGRSSKLVSRAFHHTSYNDGHYSAESYIEHGDWTRYCFGRPDSSKTALNSYVAHCPQSLNARTLNEAFLRVFYEIALPNPTHFRLHAQIHDSILFSYSAERPDLAERVRECMEIPVTIRDVSGTVRKFVVPAGLKIGIDGKRAIYWSETE
jgi:DNA polymerase I-like protein with 3'-5' exonuclease and polymerase domains